VNTGYEESGCDDVFYHDVPSELAAEARRRDSNLERPVTSNGFRDRYECVGLQGLCAGAPVDAPASDIHAAFESTRVARGDGLYRTSKPRRVWACESFVWGSMGRITILSGIC
jgi:hypothetical protein